MVRGGHNKKTHEQFVKEVEEITAGEYIVVGKYIKNDVKIPIKHLVCGYVTEMLPRNFTTGKRCAKCAGRARTPELFKKEIHELTGGEYEVLGNYVTNRTHIQVMHKPCGLIYEVMPTNILRGKGCPSCKKIKISDAKRKPSDQFEQQFKELCGEEYKLLTPYKTAKEYVKVKHELCGHEYLVVPDSIIRGSRCPKCNVSRGERKIIEFMVARNINYDSEYKFKYAEDRHPLRFDFFVEGIAIEFDGEQHYKPIKHFGGESHYIETQRRDRAKDKYCADNKIPLIRIPYWDLDNVDEILTRELLPLLKGRVS